MTWGSDAEVAEARAYIAPGAVADETPSQIIRRLAGFLSRALDALEKARRARAGDAGEIDGLRASERHWSAMVDDLEDQLKEAREERDALNARLEADRGFLAEKTARDLYGQVRDLERERDELRGMLEAGKRTTARFLEEYDSKVTQLRESQAREEKLREALLLAVHYIDHPQDFIGTDDSLIILRAANSARDTNRALASTKPAETPEGA